MEIEKNDNVKKIIYERVKEYSLSYELICNEAGIDFNRFKKYLSGLLHLEESEIVRFMECIGIEKKVVFIISDFDVDKFINKKYIEVDEEKT